MKRSKFIGLGFALLLGVSGCTINSKEIFLIPEGFRGKVTVSFNHHKDGAKQEFEPHAYVYRIPTNGVLRTAHVNDRCDNPIKERLFYYVNAKGERRLIPEAGNQIAPADANAVKIFNFKTDYISKRYPPYNILYECYHSFVVNSSDSLRKADAKSTPTP